MTIAQTIMQNTQDELIGAQAYEAFLAAEQCSSEFEQNWDDNSTTYIFEDGSRLVFSENNVRLG